MTVALPPGAFDATFPFHVVADRDLVVRQRGASMAKLLPELRPGAPLRRHLRLQRPETELSFDALVARRHELVVLVAGRTGVRLRGQVVVLPGGESLAFLGSPWFDDPAAFATSGLHLDDFALHDATPDLLMATQLQERTLVDAKALATRLEQAISRMREQYGALKRLEELHRSVLDTAPDAIVAVNEDGGVELFNEAAERMFGYRAEEILGRSAAALVPAGAVEEVRRSLEAIARGSETQQRRGAGVRKDGSRFPGEVTVGQALLGDQTLQTVFIRDVSERRAAELALLQSEQRYRQVVENVREVVFQVDREGRYTFLNASWEQITGFPVPETLGRSSLEFVHPDDVTRCMGRWRALLAGGAPGDRAEARLRHHDGGHRWVEVVTSPVVGDDGSLVGAAGTLYDLTDRRQTETELRAAKEEAERVGRLKDEFLAGMSHELRTPLNAVVGLSELLRDEVVGPVTDKQRDMLGVIGESGQHLLSLINDILDLSKIGAGHLVLRPEPIDLPTLGKACLRLVKDAAARKRLRLTASYDAQVDEVVVDPLRLKQAVVNLLSNAVKFTPAGGSVSFEVVGHPERGVVELAVTDNGIGISPDDQARLFQPFVQLDGRLSREYSGTGLGLVLVKRLVEAHGGTVSLTSRLGEGSRFVIELPVEPRGDENGDGADGATAPATAGVADAPAPARSGRRRDGAEVLVVDDDPNGRLILSELLGARGYCVRTAASGVEALRAVGDRRPAIVLMDVQMPGMDGLEATAAVRRLPGAERLPVIAVTALAMTGDRERCLAAGADDYLVKPVRFDELTTAIDRLLASTVAG